MAAVVSLAGVAVVQTDNSLRYPATNRANNLERFITVTAEAKALLVRACGDCHSNETRWTWYSYMPNWAREIQRDVRKGRERFNLSDWPALMRAGKEESR